MNYWTNGLNSSYLMAMVVGRKSYALVPLPIEEDDLIHRSSKKCKNGESFGSKEEWPKLSKQGIKLGDVGKNDVEQNGGKEMAVDTAVGMSIPGEGTGAGQQIQRKDKRPRDAGESAGVLMLMHGMDEDICHVPNRVEILNDAERHVENEVPIRVEPLKDVEGARSAESLIGPDDGMGFGEMEVNLEAPFSADLLDPGETRLDIGLNVRFWANSSILELDCEMVEETGPEAQVGYNGLNPCSQLGFDGLVCVHSVGRSGGIVTAWKRNLIDVNVICSERQFLHLQCNANGLQSFFSTTVYAIPDYTQKNILWCALRNLASSTSEPWVLMGDFNDVASSWERVGGAGSCISKMTLFCDRIEQCRLSDLGV
ncbi:hypothetical protein K1719_026580 [Acacia pycnantha]|nr:hypothetical protein K1719_026580 [Acacia pycnantha]